MKYYTDSKIFWSYTVIQKGNDNLMLNIKGWKIPPLVNKSCEVLLKESFRYLCTIFKSSEWY